MTKTEFVANVAEATKLTKKDVAAVVDAALKEVGDALSKGDKCT
ncbi:MAG: HU family DNA-binding protein, partial [Synergistaceae bacterium]|nr:HU family DNA-binding protein [Synergistaceae bacterium]